MLVIVIGEIKVSGDRLRCVFVIFLYDTKAFSESPPSRLPVSPGDLWLFAKRARYAIGDIGRGKMSLFWNGEKIEVRVDCL